MTNVLGQTGQQNIVSRTAVWSVAYTGFQCSLSYTECSSFGGGLGHSALLSNPAAAKRRKMHGKTAWISEDNYVARKTLPFVKREKGSRFEGHKNMGYFYDGFYASRVIKRGPSAS